MKTAARRLARGDLITALVALGVALLGLAEGGFGGEALGAASVVVWGLVLVGLAVGVLPRAEPPRAALGAGACLAGLAALTAVSIAWAADNGTAFVDTVRMLLYLGVFALAVIGASRGGAAPWLRGLALGLTAIAVLALLNRVQPGMLGDTELEIAHALPAAAGRLAYPIGYWNGLGAAMALCIVLLAWIGARGETRLGRALATAALPLPALGLYATSSRGGAIAAGVALVVLVGFGPARTRLVGTLAIGGAGGAALCLLANQRSDLLDRPTTELAAEQGDELTVLIAAVVIAAGILRWAADRPLARLAAPRPATIASLVAVAVAALVGLIAIDPGEQWEAFKQPPDEGTNFGTAERDLARVTSSGRYQFWATALDAFASEPARGIGSGGYEAYWTRHGSLDAPARSAHSLLLETLAELGILGAGAVVGMFAIAAVSGWRRRSSRLADADPGAGIRGDAAASALGPAGRGEVGVALAVLAGGAVAVGIDWSHDLPAVFGPVIVAAALLAGPATLPAGDRAQTAPAAPVGTRRRFAAGVATLLVAWVAICAGGLLFLSERALRASEEALAEERAAAAIEAAGDAVDLAPWAAEPRAALALAYEEAGEIASAREAIEAAIERAPEDWRIRVIAIRLDLRAGNRAAAEAELFRARELSPRDPRFQLPPERFFELLGG